MDFILTEEQKMLQTMVREFAEKELEPIAARTDEQCLYPAEAVAKMAELGLMGVPYPEQYGGTGMGPLAFAIVTEELARVCASTSTIYFVTSGLGSKPIYKFGNEEQKQKHIVPIARGQKIAAFGLTEPGAGSDAGAMTTTATKKGNGWVLNGTKIFITNGNEADVVSVFATVDKSLKHKGVTGFIVEKGMPGYKVGKLEHKLGIRGSSTAELVFEDCYVPDTNRLGAVGEGFKIAMDSISSSRISVAAQALGIAQGAFEKALAYAQERSQFGKPICEQQSIQWMLADMATQIDALRLMVYRAAWLYENSLPYLKESCMAKLFGPQVAAFCTDKAIQIHGGYGFVKDYPVERYFRDARITGIYEGTDEMQRMTIARQLISTPEKTPANLPHDKQKWVPAEPVARAVSAS
jgi:butyryl-CoA dehydrogenase